VDGNKRTAVVAVFVFYALNGFHLGAEDGDMVALALDTAQGLIDAPTIAKRLEEWVAQLEIIQEDRRSILEELAEARRLLMEAQGRLSLPEEGPIRRMLGPPPHGLGGSGSE
jgi:hypothetical protein